MIPDRIRVCFHSLFEKKLVGHKPPLLFESRRCESKSNCRTFVEAVVWIGTFLEDPCHCSDALVFHYHNPLRDSRPRFKCFGEIPPTLFFKYYSALGNVCDPNKGVVFIAHMARNELLCLLDFGLRKKFGNKSDLAIFSTVFMVVLIITESRAIGFGYDAN